MGKVVFIRKGDGVEGGVVPPAAGRGGAGKRINLHDQHPPAKKNRRNQVRTQKNTSVASG